MTTPLVHFTPADAQALAAQQPSVDDPAAVAAAAAVQVYVSRILTAVQHQARLRRRRLMLFIEGFYTDDEGDLVRDDRNFGFDIYREQIQVELARQGWVVLSSGYPGEEEYWLEW